MINPRTPPDHAKANLNFILASIQVEDSFVANAGGVEIKQGWTSALYWLPSEGIEIKQGWSNALQAPPLVKAPIQYTASITESQGVNTNFGPAESNPIPAQQTSEGQLLIDTMQSKGLLSNAEIADADESELEAMLPPYGSEEETKLFEELANELGKVFQAAGTTIADEIIAERDE